MAILGWMIQLSTLVILVLLAAPSSGQRRGNEGIRRRWSVYDYPNPHSPLREEQARCGRYNVSAVCDPNSIISRTQADAIDSLIDEVNRETMCPCRVCREGSRGYIIRVAIMPYFDRLFPDEGNTSMAMLRDAQMYSYMLTQKWGLHGSCNETVLIMYAKEDGMLFTLTRRVAKEKLTDDAIKNILMAVRHYFDNPSDIADGLMEIIRQYKLVFQDKYEEAFGRPASG